jgi:3-methyl-2-oxobutanoate hydroxymethyltransferase
LERSDGFLVNGSKVTADSLRSRKGRGRIAALTAYDFPTARLLDEAGIPLILVGDSLGMVVLGYPDTTQVTMADMEHHLRAVARAELCALLAVDLPYGSYETPAQALLNARRMLAAGAEAVKAEGGCAIIPQVRALVAKAIPFIGHLGMLPQHIRREGRYRMKGRTESERKTLLADAEALEDAGAFAIVLELVQPELAAEITRRLGIPTIGIGSGTSCDGQILVTHDLIGGFPWFTPKHAHPLAHTGQAVRDAARRWRLSLDPPA